MVGPLILQHSEMHHICQWNMQELPGFILKHSDPIFETASGCINDLRQDLQIFFVTQACHVLIRMSEALL